jgi:hypothetical protein
MQATEHFAPDVLSALERTEEVQIEPRSPDGRSSQPVTIWVVVDGGDVYVRSARGPKGRWYQALLKHPRGVLHAGQREIPFHAVPVNDAATIARVNEAYRRKYEHKWPSETAGMLRDDVVPTTLRLEPAETGA